MGYYREERWEKGRVDKQRVTGLRDGGIEEACWGPSKKAREEKATREERVGVL